MGEEHCHCNNGYNHHIVPHAPYCRTLRRGHNEIVPAASFHGYGLAMARARNDEPYEPRSTIKKVVHKEHRGICTSTREFTKTHEAGHFVDEKSGKLGFKEEVTYVSSYEPGGCNSTEYKSEVKFQNVTVFPGNNPKTTDPRTNKSKGLHVFRCCFS